jgi:TusA-related sulfurtransferase
LKFIEVYGDSSPSFPTIKKWAAEFKRGHTSLKDDPHEGCAKSATTPEITLVIYLRGCSEKFLAQQSKTNL